MITLPTRWRHWFHQKSMEGNVGYLIKQGRWGFTQEALTYLGELIPSHLRDHYPGTALKAVSGALHTHTIDELVADLGIVQRTVDTGDYVDERLLYLQPIPRTLHRYLAHREGMALTPKDAWKVFHETAYPLAVTLDSLVTTDEEITDRQYYLRRYGSVLDETFEVYRLFGTLAGFDLPGRPTT